MAEPVPLPTPLNKNARAFAIFLCWSVLVLVLLRTAWVCDDAFITARCVDNATHGFGLTFNPSERVQAFTHPLWALVFLLVHSLFDSAYFEMIFLGVFFSGLAFLLLARESKATWAWFCLPLLAISSRALIEYSTSGLENSLSYLLVTLFFVIGWRTRAGQSSVFKLALIAGCIAWNRMDLLLIVGPALALAVWRERSWRTLGSVLLGFAPFLAWEAFALFYYGFPFPNTAYAKLGAGVEPAKLWGMGRGYFLDSLQRDWVTLPLVLLASIVGLLRLKEAAAIAGVLLYLFYVARIGGDFMSGRFFAVPFMVVLIVICRICGNDGKRWLALTFPVFVLGVCSPVSMLLSGVEFSLPKKELVSGTGVADERAFYYQGTGLLIAFENSEMPIHEWASDARLVADNGPRTVLANNLGMRGFYAGPNTHIIDSFALSDPLLARIPAVIQTKTRAGHFLRRIPCGYVESVEGAENAIADAEVAALYDQLRLITRGRLFCWERLRALWGANTSRPSRKIQNEYRVPVDHTLHLDKKKSQSVAVCLENNWHVVLPEDSRQVELKISGRPYCDLVWLRGRELVQILRLNQVQTYVLDVPEGADGFALSREGSPYPCQVTGLMAH